MSTRSPMEPVDPEQLLDPATNDLDKLRYIAQCALSEETDRSSVMEKTTIVALFATQVCCEVFKYLWCSGHE